MKYIFFGLALLLLFSCGQSKNSKTNVSKERDTITEINDSLFNIECLHVDLSDEFNLKVSVVKFLGINKDYDSSIVEIQVFDKKLNSCVDTVSLTSIFYSKDNFDHCTATRSYSTGKDSAQSPIDNDYGDIIIADLNFDGNDDIVVVADMGGNGGIFYNYYLQTKDMQFQLDPFLSDSVIYFPCEVNKQKKTLMTRVRACADGYVENLFKYDNISKTWKRKSQKLIGDCEW